MATDLVPGAVIAMPGPAVDVSITGPYDVSALVVGADGLVATDADLVFYNAPDAPGVRLSGTRLAVRPARLRRGAERVVVVASPDVPGTPLGRLPAPAVSFADERGRAFARFVVPRLSTETVLLVAEVYRRGDGWRLRAVGQGYADGLAGLARDFGVEVDDDGEPDDARCAAVVTATNAERARHRLPPLTVDARLAAAARRHSADMVARGFFAHTDPDGLGVDARVRAAGYSYRVVAENIAAGQPDAATVVDAWMHSPGHRANILRPEVTQIGVGIATGGIGIHWTQVFATPL
ncbi:CAP domain-containing protein [Pseudonocardia sp. CA-107938]|uniref:CAP domain-containing protein n=1 Tax=Pseudonocardia sp. CA-107938 TaxID=3240021 RepID=UPI003D8FFDAD